KLFSEKIVKRDFEMIIISDKKKKKKKNNNITLLAASRPCCGFTRLITFM
ncbi:hypothetical protein BDDG_13610, partial [Blastomyces dermatitidis ATCC 18188]